MHRLLCEVVRAQRVDARRWPPCLNVGVRAAAVWKVGRLSCRFAAVCIALPLPLRVRALNRQKLQPTPKLHPMSVQLMNPTICTWRGMQVLQVRIVFAVWGSAIRSALPALRHGRRSGLHIWEAHGDWAVSFARLGHIIHHAGAIHHAPAGPNSRLWSRLHVEQVPE